MLKAMMAAGKRHEPAATTAMGPRLETNPAVVPRAKCMACRALPDLFPFTMAFQPIIDLDHMRIDAYEALVRGPNGESASDVLGRVNRDNLYAFDQSCRIKAIELASHLRMDKQLNINFLPNAVYEPSACIRTTLETAARTGFPRDRLTFEIVENETITSHQHLMRIITEYRRHGFKIALDDFGTGYSGLSRLAEMRPDIVKVDRSLIVDCHQDKFKMSIVSGLVAIGRETGVKIVIEGVEKEEEVRSLHDAGVRFMQGYFFARPKFEGISVQVDLSSICDLAESKLCS